ncbi:glycerophosphodiester phosphodiesterase [Ferrimonas marina]|uniref:Glycerophosphoryl diester phosphodiesterase n=1 Tax=Ferrimonas marina TaxID=299255 RepID=A0A1M5XAA0_9GAMM|nr:glycerophosphodiester phosphodiesterase family protein [Ferrimonas marina]SHH96649.1 glycerophosphoryl diester phosphodiesterase [Ferrimonas marina]
MLIIAHRGASGEAPENTLAAMTLAVAQQADAIELDVHRVEDTLVVIHDRFLDKTTSGRGPVSQSTLAQLAQLDAGQGERVPTLWQVLECVGARCGLNIELKGMATDELLLPLLEQAVAQLGYRWEQFLVSSFHHPMLARIKGTKPDLRIGALTASCPLNYAEFASELAADAVHLDVDFADPALIADAQQRGLKVYVYTVDKAEDLAQMAALGVDGVFTNFPARSRAQLGLTDPTPRGWD